MEPSVDIQTIPRQTSQVVSLPALAHDYRNDTNSQSMHSEVAISTIANGLTGALLRRFNVDPTLYGVILSAFTTTLHSMRSLAANGQAILTSPSTESGARSTGIATALFPSLPQWQSTVMKKSQQFGHLLRQQLGRMLPSRCRVFLSKTDGRIVLVSLMCLVIIEWRTQLLRSSLLSWWRNLFRSAFERVPFEFVLNLYDGSSIETFIEYQSISAPGVFGFPQELNYGHPDSMVKAAVKSDVLTRLLAARGTVYSSIGQCVTFEDEVDGFRVQGRFSWEHANVTVPGQSALICKESSSSKSKRSKSRKQSNKTRNELASDSDPDTDQDEADGNRKVRMATTTSPDQTVALPFLRVVLVTRRHKILQHGRSITGLRGDCQTETVISNVRYWKHVTDTVEAAQLRSNMIKLDYVHVTGSSAERCVIYPMYVGENHSYDTLETNLINSFFQQQRKQIWGLIKAVQLNPQEFFRRGQIPRFSCLLHGPPGSGKSSFAYRIARALKRHLVSIDLLRAGGFKVVEQILREPCIRGRDLQPKDVVFFFDEIDIALLEMLDREAEEAAEAERIQLQNKRARERRRRADEKEEQQHQNNPHKSVDGEVMLAPMLTPQRSPSSMSPSTSPQPGADTQSSQQQQQQQQQQLTTAHLSLLVANLNKSLGESRQKNKSRVRRSGSSDKATESCSDISDVSDSNDDTENSNQDTRMRLTQSYSKRLKPVPTNANQLLHSEQLLELIEGPVPLEGAILIATTNKFEVLYKRFPRLFRPGRFGPIYFGYVDVNVLTDMIAHFFATEVKREELQITVDENHTVSSSQLVQWAMLTSFAGGFSAFRSLIHQHTVYIRIERRLTAHAEPSARAQSSQS